MIQSPAWTRMAFPRVAALPLFKSTRIAIWPWFADWRMTVTRLGLGESRDAAAADAGAGQVV